ncbi:collagen-like protein [Lentiprolixibacter aurantiacus]|uniref:Collagen-like protein n=1 Tax=Lentiprolixibacter aurantiacus TaxID=2993939 RepID=A0AAE3MMA0_9FLAO|nr:collagen-like protein [Lentiprolixibacter aurantiacus]MCX2719976.1 collagen-like protein [Lentiprolixibacter aurantiacus]
MKKVSLLLALIATVFFVSCEGPAGPPGFDGLDGLDGLDGVNILGQVIDIEGTFDFNNDYTLFYEFPNSVEVFESDVVLVYILWGQTEDNNGDPVDIWRLLPQTRLLNQGILLYNYDYTFFDVNIFLEADFDLETLLPGDTDNQVFRIAIVPAEFAQSRLDRTNVEQVMNLLKVEEKDIPRYKLN